MRLIAAHTNIIDSLKQEIHQLFSSTPSLTQLYEYCDMDSQRSSISSTSRCSIIYINKI
jgi:hypothetical protein